jgi:DNA-binding transcriptional LysR family regulator
MLFRSLSSILSKYERLAADVMNMGIAESNHLSISFNGPTEWANIHEVIKAFHQKYPQIEIEVEVARWGQLVSEVINGNLDLIFTEQAEIHDVAGIKSVYLFRDYATLAVPKSSSLAAYEKINPETSIYKKFIANKNLVIEGEKSSVKSMPKIYERLSNAGINMKNVKLVDDYDAAIAMVSSDIAIAPIPCSFKVKGHQSVSYVDIDSDKVYLDFCLAWSAKNEKPSIGLFKDFCIKHKW